MTKYQIKQKRDNLLGKIDAVAKLLKQTKDDNKLQNLLTLSLEYQKELRRIS